MNQTETISKTIDDFFADQHEKANRYAKQGAPAGGIISALDDIRQSLTKLNSTSDLKNWKTKNIEQLQQAKIKYKKTHNDSAGYGSATFTEILDILYLLEI